MGKNIFLIFLLLLVSTLVFSVDYWGGWIFFNDGNYLRVEKFSKIYGKAESSGRYLDFSECPLFFKATPEGIRREIEWNKILSIVLNGQEWEEDEIIHLQLRDQRMWDVYLDWGYISHLKVDYYDEYSMELMLDREFDMENIKALVFSVDYGNMKVNTETGAIYPREYVFDPYTGNKLEYFVYRK